MRLLHLIATLAILSSFQVTRVSATYTVTDTYTDDAHSYFTASLQYSGEQPYYVNESNIVIQNLNFTYFFASAGHLIVKITDNSTQRWEVPYAPPFPHIDVTKKFQPYDNANVQVVVTENPFSFKVTRKDTSEVIFDSSAGDFIYSDYYLQLSTALPTSNIYGFGERATKFDLAPDATYTLLTKDNPADLEDGTPGHNLYGYHPVYLLREKSNSFHVGLLRSSSPMDVQLEGGKKLTYKVVGGIIDFNFFVGNDAADAKPETVVKQYHTYLGGWTLQPFWSFGFHQCRWGYHSISDLKGVLDGYASNNLPLDVIWTDIDYMDSFVDFTIDKTNFPPDQMRQMLKDYNKRWVPIIDAGIALNNDIYNIGGNNNIFVHDPNGANLLGYTGPGNVNFADWFDPNASMFWTIGLNELHEQIPFSGIWTDVNEVYSAAAGEVNWSPNSTDLTNNPPYIPNRPGELLYDKTMRMDALHYGNILELNVHNTFGFLESKATYNFLKSLGDLVFTLSRSTFYGSGQYAAHWSGDNVANYDFLFVSLSTVMDFNLFGIPMTGADICGFNGDTTVELCSRWFQLGTLYPFARDHNMPNTIPQEPYALGPTVLETARVSLSFRYSVLRHYYTQFLKQAGVGTIFRPVFFEYPTDENLYNADLGYTNNQFLIGEALMAVPCMVQGQENVNVYFPQDDWFDFITGELVVSAQQAPGNLSYPAPLNATAPIFVRGGQIVPLQNVTNVNRTDDLNNQYQLNIAFKSSETAGVFTAQGQLVGISSFDDNNVLVKCRLGNCLYSLNANITVTESSYEVYVSFATQGDSKNYETVELTGLVLMGNWDPQIIAAIHETPCLVNNMGTVIDVEQKSGSVIYYNFATQYIVSDGAVVKISIPTMIDI